MSTGQQTIKVVKTDTITPYSNTYVSINNCQVYDNRVVCNQLETGTLIFSNPIPIVSGGTGGTSIATARSNLGIGSLASDNRNNVNITGGNINVLNLVTDTINFTSPLPVASGGTSGATASDARVGLGLGTLSTQNANAVNIIGGTISGLSSGIPVASGGTGGTTQATAQSGLGLGSICTQPANNVAITGGSIILTTPLPVGSGGTGGNTQVSGRSGLGLGTLSTQSADNVAITGGSVANVSLTLSTPLPVGSGGTGGTTQADARSGLGLGSVSTQPASGVSITGGTISNVNINSATIATSSISSLSSPLSVSYGGTGGSSQSTARSGLGLGSVSTQDANNVNLTGGLIGGETVPEVASATGLANSATSSNTASQIVRRDANGSFSAGMIVADLTGNVTGSATSLSGSFAGDVTGTQGSSVVSFVGGQTSSAVASGTQLANGATNLNTTGTIVKRNGNGDFFAGTITGSLLGNVTGNTSGSSASFTGSLLGDVTGTQGSTSVAFVGGQTASAVANGVQLANNATNLNVTGTLVKRNGNGSFSAGMITGSLTGNVTGLASGNVNKNADDTMNGNYIVNGNLTMNDLNVLTAKNLVSDYQHADQMVTVKIASTYGANEYASVKSALTSILDAGTTKRYCIRVRAGTYYEDNPIQLKDYVTIVGESDLSSIIQANNISQDLLLGTSNSTIRFLQLTGSTGSGKALIRHTIAGSGGRFFAFGCRFVNADILVNVIDAYCGIFSCIIGGTAEFRQGFVVSSTTGAYILVDGLIWEVLTNSLLDELVYATGSASQCILQNVYAGNNSGFTSSGNRYFTRFENGAIVRTNAVTIAGFSKGLYIPNVGATGPDISVVGLSIKNTTNAVDIEHTGTTGAVACECNRASMVIATGVNIALAVNDRLGGNMFVGNQYFGASYDQIANFTPSFQSGVTLGLISGGVVTHTTGRNIKATAGTGYVSNSSPEYTKLLTWADQTVEVSANFEGWFYINNVGTFTYNVVYPEELVAIVLGKCRTDASTVLYIQYVPHSGVHLPNQIHEALEDTLDNIFISGSEVSKYNATSTNIDVSSGSYFFSSTEYEPSGGTPLSGWLAFYQGNTASPSWQWNVVNQNTIDYNHYDIGTGTLGTLTANYFTRHNLYVSGDGVYEQYYLVYGTTQYDISANAIAGVDPAPPSTWSYNIAKLCAIIVQNTTTPSLQIGTIIDERPRLAMTASAIASSAYHDSLLERGNDGAHSQYLLKKGDTMVGTLNMNVNPITNILSATFDNTSTLSANTPLKLGASKNIISGNIDLTNDVENVLQIANGGTNSSTTLSNKRIMISSGGKIVESSTLYDGQFLMGRNADVPVSATLTGTTNQIIVSPNITAEQIILSTPQNIHTGATPTFASETLSATSSQLKLGAGSAITTLTSPPAGSNRTITLPDAGASSSFVLTEGAQTINGNKTISGTTILSSLAGSLPLQLNSSNQIISGGIDLNTQTSGILPIANGGTNSSTALTGNRIMLSSSNGSSIKEFSSTLSNGQILIGTAGVPVAGTITGTTNRITVTNGLGTISLSTPQNTDISATPIFSALALSSSSNQIILGDPSTHTLTLTAPTPASNIFYTIPDVGSNASFAMTEGTQTINGSRTFSGTLTLSSLTPSLPMQLNGSRQVVASSINLSTVTNTSGTLPISRGGTGQTSFSGYKILTTNVDGTAIAQQGLLAGEFIIGSASGQMANASITGTTDQISVAKGDNTITLSLPQDITTSSNVGFNTGKFSATTSQLILGNSTNTTLNSPAPSANRIYTMPDAGKNTTFILADAPAGTSQTIYSNLILDGTVNLPNITASKPMKLDGSGNIITGAININSAETTGTLPITRGGTGLTSFPNNRVMMTSSNGLITEANAFTDGQIMIGITGSAPVLSTISGTANQVVVTNSAGAIAISLPSTLTLTTATMNNIKLLDTTNQVHLGTGTAVTTLSSPPAWANRIYTIPDANTDTTFIMTDFIGTQTINSNLILTGTVLAQGLTPSLPMKINAGNYITSQLINISSASDVTGTLPVGSGGTSSSTSLLNNRIMISRSGAIVESGTMQDGYVLVGRTGNYPVPATLTGTPNQISVSNGAGSITLATPQDIAQASSPTFDALTLTVSSNQLQLGTGNTVTVSASAPASSRLVTIPDTGSANASFVMTEGAQTINGNKIFSGYTNLSASTNQITLGTGNAITTLTSPAPSANRTVTLPNAGASSSFVLTESAQTINGNKTISGYTTLSSLTNFSPTTNQITLGTGNAITTLTSPAPSANRTVTLPDAGASSSFVLTESAQTINGNKIFSGYTNLSGTTNQITLGSGTAITTLTSPAPSSNKVYTIPDVSANASFVMTEGVQTINGNKTIAGYTILSAKTNFSSTTNQIALGTGTAITTLTSPAPTSNKIYTIPDVSANASFVMTEGTQTINGNKTLSGITTLSALSNQLVFGTTNITTLNVVAPVASRIYTMPDVGANAYVMLNTGTAVIISGTPSAGQVLTATSPSAASWATETASLSYGEVYFQNAITGYSQASSALPNWTKMIAFAQTGGGAGVSSGMTVSAVNSNITVLNTGIYQINMAMSTSGTTATYYIAVHINGGGSPSVGNPMNNLYTVDRPNNANQWDNVCLMGILSLTANDVVDVRVTNTNTAIIIRSMNLSIIQL